MREKVILSFSGGKDSILALYHLKKDKKIKVVGLFTTINNYYKRVSIQGIRETLLKKQVKLLNIPLKIAYLPKRVSNKEYQRIMLKNLKSYLIKRGIDSIAFGDIFLEDVKRYREENLSKIGIKALFPLWRKDTKNLAQRFIRLGFKAKIISVSSSHKRLKKFLGEDFNELFLAEIKNNIDPCGERGEFHTLVYDGPLFKQPLKFKLGKKILKNGNYYIDCF